MGRRLDRLNEQLRRELADLLLTEVKDPRVGSVTVTGVRVSPDLAVARVLVSTPGQEGREESMEGLRAAAAFLRTSIANRLSIRHAPELRFEVDASQDHARHIESLLREVRPEGGWESDEDAAEPDGSAADADASGSASDALPDDGDERA
ncbi:MAG: 30S ribosome-binding factor RbfA [Gemmatimonadota bacterium]